MRSSLIFTPFNTNACTEQRLYQRAQQHVCVCERRTWGDSGGDGGGRDHALARRRERCHLQGVGGGGGEAGQLVLQSRVG